MYAHRLLGALLIAAVSTAAGAAGEADKLARPPRLDRGKGSIEIPVKDFIAATRAPAPKKLPAAGLRSKAVIEFPTKRLIARDASPIETTKNSAAASRSPNAASKLDNPKVEPGKVKWHADFKTACKVAEKTGKPVLLFQLLGNLDERFT